MRKHFLGRKNKSFGVKFGGNVESSRIGGLDNENRPNRFFAVHSLTAADGLMTI